MRYHQQLELDEGAVRPKGCRVVWIQPHVSNLRVYASTRSLTRISAGGFPGGQAEYVRVPFGDVNCLKVPPGVPGRLPKTLR